MTRGFPKPGGRHGDDDVKIGRAGMEPVLDFIDRSIKKEKPLSFIWYAPFLPHTPHNPPERLHKYLAKGVQKRVAQYYAMCEWFDETCGTLVNHIDESGIGEDTLIVYVTDNGWIQTETGSYDPRSNAVPMKVAPVTPSLFRWKGTIPANDRPELCSSIDFVPTVLAAAGANGPHDFPGLNLLPELKSGKRSSGILSSVSRLLMTLLMSKIHQASLLYRWVIKGHDKLLLTYDGAPGKNEVSAPGWGGSTFRSQKGSGRKNKPRPKESKAG